MPQKDKTKGQTVETKESDIGLQCLFACINVK